MEPPAQARPGSILDPPMIIRLRKMPTQAGQESAEDPSLLFAFMSLTAEDGSTSLAPPRNDLLTGTLSDSIHSLQQDLYPDDTELGFASFPEVVINDPGSYRLKISIMKMDTSAGSRFQGAVNLQTSLSRVIRVDHEAQGRALGM